LIFLTEHKKKINGKRYSGPDIEAENQEEAEGKVGKELKVIGELVYECKCYNLPNEEIQ